MMPSSKIKIYLVPYSSSVNNGLDAIGHSGRAARFYQKDMDEEIGEVIDEQVDSYVIIMLLIRLIK